MPRGQTFNAYLEEQLALDPRLEEQLKQGAIELELGIALTRLREKRGYTQRELAERCDFKQPMIARIERAGQNPSVPTMLKILRALNGSLHIGADGRVTARPMEEAESVPVVWNGVERRHPMLPLTAGDAYSPATDVEGRDTDGQKVPPTALEMQEPRLLPRVERPMIPFKLRSGNGLNGNWGRKQVAENPTTYKATDEALELAC